MNPSKKAPPRFSLSFFRQFRHLRNRGATIGNGQTARNAEEVRLTSTLKGNDTTVDLKGWATSTLIVYRDLSEQQRTVLRELVHEVPTLDALQALWDLSSRHEEIQERLDIYMSIYGDTEALGRELYRAVRRTFDGYAVVDDVHHWVWILGLITELRAAEKTPGSFSVDVKAIRSSGIARMDMLARSWPEFEACMQHNPGDDVAVPASGEDELYAALRGAALEAASEDRAEIDFDFQIEENVELETMRVLGTLDTGKMSSAKRDQTRSLSTIADKQLPIPAPPSDLGGWTVGLCEEFPHLEDVVDRIAHMLATMRSVRGLRLLFVGPPGGGKTEFGRSLFESLQVPSVVYACGGSSDGSFGGTSSMYATARAPLPLQMIGNHQCAGVGIVLDEVDKIGTGRHNGNLADALLSFLEPSSSRRILDPLTETEVNLSAVNYIATANDITSVPGPLRDRFRIIQVPGATCEHVGSLSSSIIKRIAAERGLRHGWLQPLAGDELDVIKGAWTGGSLRRLRQAVEVIVDGRDRMMGRH